MSFSIAIVGPHEEILGFSALGFRTFSVDTAEEAKEVLFDLKKRITNEEDGEETETFGIIFVIEDFIKTIPADEYTKLTSGALPSIISLPGNRGSTGFGNEKIRRIVEKAVGSDIFGNE